MDRRLNASASVVLTPLVEPLVARIEGGSERTVDARRSNPEKDRYPNPNPNPDLNRSTRAAP